MTDPLVTQAVLVLYVTDTTNTPELGLNTTQPRHDQWFVNVRHIHQDFTFIHSVTYRDTVQALKAPHILQSRHYILQYRCQSGWFACG
jgi:hypothetical protein